VTPAVSIGRARAADPLRWRPAPRPADISLCGRVIWLPLLGCNANSVVRPICPGGRGVDRTSVATETGSGALYLPALDGLRFFAFLLVFIHHLPQGGSGTFLALIHQYGWIGVDIFFAISGYLLYQLLILEHSRTGRIGLSAFYARRFLRIYPLMLSFPILMLIVFGPSGENWSQRLAAIAVGLDNFMCWITGYNFAIPFTAHLWTLSYELQIYAILPLAFLGLSGTSTRKALIILLSIELVAIVARWAFATGGAVHPMIWVTPFLRPESTLVGIAIAIARPRPRPFLLILVLVGVASLLLSGPAGTEMGNWTAVLYVLVGLIAGSALLLPYRFRRWRVSCRARPSAISARSRSASTSITGSG